MRGYAGVLAAVVVGAGAGLLIGLSVRGLNAGTLGLAAAALTAAVTTPFAVGWLEGRRARAHDDAAARRQLQDRYDAHARQLDQAVFARLPETVFLEAERTYSDEAPGNLPLGLPGPGVAEPLDGLPGWSFALDHFRDDAAAARAWEELWQAAELRNRIRAELRRQLVERISSEVLQEYGFDTPLEGGRLRPAPWVDVNGIAMLSMEKATSSGPVRWLELPPRPAVGRDAPGPYSVLSGSLEVVRAQDRDQADPHRLDRILKILSSDASLMGGLHLALSEEDRARASLERFRSAARRYHDRVAVGGSLRGDCEICRPWSARERPG
ncbi:MAG TPA: hypothetical protein VFG07_05030 [Thermoplasmata archaeon]|nr:hypothetical protein [Thermoplasmata archaeon]